MTLAEIKKGLDCETFISPDDLRIVSITYNDLEIPHDVYQNKINTIEDKSYLFEYNPIIDLYKSNYFDLAKYTGVFSWKFQDKTGLSKNLLYKLLDTNDYQGYDIIHFCRPLGKPYLEFTEENHHGFLKLFTLICNDLNLQVKEPIHTIYSNFFIAKSEIYKSYISECLIPAIDLLENKYKDLAWKNANYKSGLTEKALKKYTGLEYYTFHTFILERLFSVWINNNLKVLKIC